MKIQFANKKVNIKKLVQGAVVLYQCEADEVPDIYHIHKFTCFNAQDNTIDLVVVDDLGKWTKNSVDLIWPI